MLERLSRESSEYSVFLPLFFTKLIEFITESVNFVMHEMESITQSIHLLMKSVNLIMKSVNLFFEGSQFFYDKCLEVLISHSDVLDDRFSLSIFLFP